MAAKDKNKSLVEIAVELVHDKHKVSKGPFAITSIAKEAMEIKGLKTKEGRELLPQFFADFMESGYFIYCGDGKWDLKEYVSTSDLEKEDTYITDPDADEAKINELGEGEDEYDMPTNKEEAKEEENNDEDENENEEDKDFSLDDYEGETEEEKPNADISSEGEEVNDQETSMSVDEIDDLQEL